VSAIEQRKPAIAGGTPARGAGDAGPSD